MFCFRSLRPLSFAVSFLFLGTQLSYLKAQQPAPTITTIATGMGGTATTNIAPGGLITITGTNLAAARGDLANYSGGALPTSIANVQVTIAGRQAPLFMVSPTMIVAQVPYEVAPGPQTITVTSGSTNSTAFSITVAAMAPAVYSDPNTGIVKASDYSQIGAGNPAAPGDIVLLYATGLGQTTPVMQTGVPYTSGTIANTSPVTVMIGGQSATVVYSVAAPGFAGLYQIAARVPTGVSGTVPVVLQSGSSTSVAVNLVVGILRAGSIDPQLQAVFMQYMALGPKPIQTLTPQEARLQPSFADAVRALRQSQGQSVAPEPVASVTDISVPGGAGQIPARVYTPTGAGPFPIIMYFHGGGFVIATNDTYDASARAIANAAGAIVVAVEYRKAPENPFPAAPEDAYAATQWAFNNAASINGRADRIATAGESAGGNLATVVCMMARDRNGRMPVYQGLVYPVATLATQSRSYEENANAPFLTKAALLWFGSYYLANPLQDALNPYASPLLGNVNGLPPATVITAGFDPLRDEGAAYADKLRQAGITVDYRNYDSAVHEFFGMGSVVSQSNTAVQQLANDLKAAFAR